MSVRVARAVVLGIGREAAGDDGVGLLVARAVAAQGLSAVESADATVLLALLADGRRVILVDAVAGAAQAGEILHLRPDDLATGHTPVSSHGIGVAAALALGGVLLGADALHGIDIVGVTVAGEPKTGSSISAAVAASVRPAAALAVQLAQRRWV